MVCGALAAVQTVLSASLSALSPGAAAVFPPAYALLAAVHSLMPFLARVLTGTPWTATITSGIAGVLIWPFSAVGPLVLIVLVVGSSVFDLVLRRRGVPSRGRLAAAAACAAAALFVVSLPVFSSAHLTPFILTATLAARVLGEGAAAGAAVALSAGLRRVGVRSR